MGRFDIFYKFRNVPNISDGFLLFIRRYFFKYWERFLLFDVSLKDRNLKRWLKSLSTGPLVNLSPARHYKPEWNTCSGAPS